MADEDPIDGCAHCGIAQRGHGQRHTIAAGWHSWAVPDARLLRQRMWYRRLTRLWVRTAREAEAVGRA